MPMLIGIMADTHDNPPMVEKAIKKLNGASVELALNARDYNSPFVIPPFKELRAKLIGVFGNNDGGHEFLKKRFRENERLEIRGNFAEIASGKLKIALMHGSDRELLKSLVKGESFDLIVHGHTHNAETCRKGETLVANSGEVCGYLSGKPTVALFDADRFEAKIVDL